MEDGSELHREWRAIVLSKLDTLERGQKAVEEKVVGFAMNTVKNEDYERLEARVRSLEETKVKALAAWAVIQGLSVAAAWLVSVLLKN